MAESVEGSISPESLQVDEIQDQMRNQERLLAQLHESIIEQDKQMLGREAEAQSYASKLKSLKSRHLQDQKGHDKGTQETSGASSPTSHTPKTSGGLTLLRQKVEENRLKVAQRSRQELESKRELEEKVLALKSQVEEIQKVSTTPTLPEQNPVDTQMIVLQEQIQAKDSLIEARTRAITLLTEDFSRKRKEVVDQLEETREEMRHMQKNFISSEDHYKAEIQARDKRLFEMDLKLRTLNAKLEHSEELSIVVADKERLQKQVNDLLVIRNEKQCLEDKVEELLNFQNSYKQKEVEIAIIQGEKQKLQAELSEMSHKREEDSSTHQKKNQNLQKKLEKLSKHLALNEKKIKELNVVINTFQANEEKLHSLLDEKQNLEEKIEELTRLVDSQHQERIEETTGTCVVTNAQQDNEMAILLKEQQRLQQQLKSLSEFFNSQQYEERHSSTKRQDYSKKFLEVLDLTKLLLINDKKITDLNHLWSLNKSGDVTCGQTLEQVKLEERSQQLSNLLTVYQHTVNDLCTQKQEESTNWLTQTIEEQIIFDGTKKTTQEVVCPLIDTNQQNKEEIESFTRALNASEQKLSEQSSVLTVLKLKEAELLNDLSIYQEKCEQINVILQEKDNLQEQVDELSKHLSEIQYKHNEELMMVLKEKQELDTKVQNIFNILEIHDSNWEEFGTQYKAKQEQCNEELSTLLKEKEVLEGKVQELTATIDCNQQNLNHLNVNLYQYDQQISATFEEKKVLQNKVVELSNLFASREQSLQSLTDQLKSLQHQHNEELSAISQEKKLLQEKLDMLTKHVAANEQNLQGLNEQLITSQQQHSKELTTVLNEKQLLQDNLGELSNLLAANEQHMQGLNEQLITSQQQHSQEVSTLLNEKQQLQDNLGELSNLLAANEQHMQGLNEQLITSQQQHSEELSTLLNEKQQHQDKVGELSNLLAANEHNMQRLNEQAIGYQHQHTEELSAVLKERVLLEEQIQEMSMLIITKDQEVHGIKDQLDSTHEIHNKELSSLLEEKRVAQDKVAELSKVIDPLKCNLERLSNQLQSVQVQNDKELSSLLNEKQLLQSKVDELFALANANGQNAQRLNDQLLISQQQYNKELSGIIEDKELLQIEVRTLSGLLCRTEHIVQELNSQLSSDQHHYFKEVSSFIEEKEFLKEKCLEVSNLLAANEQRVQGMKSVNQEQQSELSSLMQEKGVLEEDVQDLSKVIANNEQTMRELNAQLISGQQLHNEALSALLQEKELLQEEVVKLSDQLDASNRDLHAQLTASQQQQSEWSTLLAEKQFLQENVRELCYCLQQNVQELSELKLGNSDFKTEISSSLNYTELDQVDIHSIVTEFKANNVQLKQNICDYIAEMHSTMHDQIQETSENAAIVLQEKSNLQLQLEEVTKLLKEAEKREELAHSQADKKIAHLKHQVNSLKKGNDSNVMIVDLQNRIAELEEEKGNLQLHLVDFEEMKAHGVDLTAQVESLQGQKVIAEMKSVELEEELDLIKSQPEYLENQSAVIKSLNTQLKNHVERNNFLAQSLLECETELGDREKRFLALQQQLEENILELKANIEGKEIEIHGCKEKMCHMQASLDDVLETNNRIKHSIERFCNDILNGRLHEPDVECALEVETNTQDATFQLMHNLEEVKLELIPVLDDARRSLVNREVLLNSLQTDLSNTRDHITSLENQLQQLKNYETENISLRNEIDTLKSLVQEKQEIDKQILSQSLEVGNTPISQVIAWDDVSSEAWLPVESTIQATQSRLQESEPTQEPKVNQLEREKEKLSEELKSAQVRSGKLIKKIKSMKADYDLLAAENLKLNQTLSLEPNIERDRIEFLQQEVWKLQSELEKKVKKMDEASTQADDYQLTWLTNEYETMKQEVQHLIEEIDLKDTMSVQLAERLQCKENNVSDLSQMIDTLTAAIGVKENRIKHLEELLQHYVNIDDSVVVKEVEPHRKQLDEVLHLLRQKEEEVIHLGELLQQHMDGGLEDESSHKQLDNALYMLHQKEVRCDELTLELMQLLEERDTLQLRLSTTIRQYEELRSSCSHAEEKCASSPSSSPTNSPALTNKLQQVRSMGREQRSLALQQRADTTVSRDNLSQSETLINWIRGRTTPKVVHI